MNRVDSMRDEGGSVMVEMAGAIAILVFLVFGITELGRALYQLNTINKAASSGARYISRVQGIVGSPTDIPPCEAQAGWASAVNKAQNMVIYGSEAADGIAIIEDISVAVDDPEQRAYEAGGATTFDCVVIVRASATFQSMFGGSIYLPLFGQAEDADLVLRAQAEERYLGLNYAPSP